MTMNNGGGGGDNANTGDNAGDDNNSGSGGSGGGVREDLTQRGANTNTGGDNSGDNNDGGDGDGETFDQERAMSTIRNMRQAERDLKKQNADMAKRIKEIEDADKTELQKTQDEVARLQKVEEEYNNSRKY